jgi:hypothetical protein
MVVWTADVKVERSPVRDAGGGSDCLASQGVMRISHHNFQGLFLGSM